MPAYVYTGVGRENSTLLNLKAAAKQCKDIVSAAVTPWPGYVQIEVRSGDEAEIKNTKLNIPPNTKVVIEMVPGVIKVLDNQAP